jgi:hypothetical protein
MPRRDLQRVSRGGRCAWCFEPLGEFDSHAIVRDVSDPPLKLRFHHRFWASYRGLPGVEGGEPRALYREGKSALSRPWAFARTCLD